LTKLLTLAPSFCTLGNEGDELVSTAAISQQWHAD